MAQPSITTYVPSWLNVRDYGATGTGNTNDAPAFVAAMLAASQAGGGTVVVPSGTYRLDSTVSWTALTYVMVWVNTGALFTGSGSIASASGTGNSVYDQSSGSGAVSSLTAGTGISVSGATGAVTVTNAGVTSLVAGTNISISGATGAVTVSSTASAAGYTRTFLFLGA